MALASTLHGSWNRFQLANKTPPLSVIGRVIVPYAMIHPPRVYSTYKPFCAANIFSLTRGPMPPRTQCAKAATERGAAAAAATNGGRVGRRLDMFRAGDADQPHQSRQSHIQHTMGTHMLSLREQSRQRPPFTYRDDKPLFSWCTSIRWAEAMADTRRITSAIIFGAHLIDFTEQTTCLR